MRSRLVGREFGGVQREQTERIPEREEAHLFRRDLGAEDVAAFERTSVAGECGALSGHERMFARNTPTRQWKFKLAWPGQRSGSNTPAGQ